MKPARGRRNDPRNISFVQVVAIACVLLSPAIHAQSVSRSFVPAEVFAGRSEGQGQLWLTLGKGRPFTVASLGTRQADGRFRLEQVIRFGARPVQLRTWIIWPLSPGNYSATLTDAAGPVVLRSEGSRLMLRYPLNRWGMTMQQNLDLAENGRTVVNSGRILFLGVQVGKVQETIQLQR